MTHHYCPACEPDYVERHLTEPTTGKRLIYMLAVVVGAPVGWLLVKLDGLR